MRTDRERPEEIAAYVIRTGATVRTAAKAFSISKSTVHKDLTVRLRRLNPSLYAEAAHVLEKNKAERHLRGGEATRKKYLNERMLRKSREKFYS